ncbi:conserved Plasmodium protein, unknown function [Plasmodium vivax]|uniref:Uncharacterized protein n=1 Tax=Plasmodium vivax TaxID=5855 RepID=A0A564ZRK1_PLAVI|nr:conserved Plasmodium protein, unknown function [Plasmodium vivax]
MRRIRTGAGPAPLPRLPPLPLLLLLLLVLLTAGGVAKCEEPNEGANQVAASNTTEERIRDVLNSVSVGQAIKRERNLLDDVAKYINYLKVLSLVAPRGNVEGGRHGHGERVGRGESADDGFINVDATAKGAMEKRRVNIRYFSQGNNYKNNVNDVRREVNRVLFT